MWLAVARRDLVAAQAVLDAHVRRTVSAVELAALDAVVDFDQAEATCPACGTSFSTDRASCPDCGLRFA